MHARGVVAQTPGPEGLADEVWVLQARAAVRTLDPAIGYTRQTERVRVHLRKKIERELAHLTGDPTTEMRWTLERLAKHCTLVEHRLRIVGRLHGTKFGNPSDNAASLDELVGLHRPWDRGDLRFERVSVEEAEAARANCELAAPTPFVVARGSRSDEGERRDPGVRSSSWGCGSGGRLAW
ncbi:uncharacterized protein BXZ73DRAFT_76250 [Epithele typhae]|uniref:uncharacterized protein n=1 Tax=Epithele typhae TaxID=378194 RepID=UPI002008BB69|nr:uncharacterized protein BXZ73DRAFT_76250 [Epithele typhae]KAH9939120.1 hypothetical protein BXZ73DRAFT_76250 [Epithele typhae]